MLAVLAGCPGDDGGGATTPDASTPAAACAAPTGPGTVHSTEIAADETWTAAASPHIVDWHITVREATLTIEPCAVVRLRKGYFITVDTAGALVAHGESIANDGAPPTVRPVTFERDVAGEPWGSILVYAPARIDLEHVRLVGGGDPDTAASLGGTIIVRGEGGNKGLARIARLVDVTIEESAGFGLNAQSRGGFTADSRDVVVTGSGFVPSGTNIDTSYAIYVDGPSFTTIPPGRYTGNATDEILLANAGSLLDPELRFHDRGIPYHLLDGFSMAPEKTAMEGGLSTLYIDAGVTILVNRDDTGYHEIGLGASNGSLPENIWPTRLVAEGTAAAPIVLTSAERVPIAGDWVGIAWAGGPGTGNVMKHVRIEYAGSWSGTSGFGCGPTANDAALIIHNWRPENVFITDSTFSNSAGGGITSGWSSDANGPNLRANNKFVNIAGECEVSRWADANGSCPAQPPLCL